MLPTYNIMGEKGMLRVLLRRTQSIPKVWQV